MMKKNRHNRFCLLLAFIAAASLAAGCSKTEPAKQQAQESAPPPAKQEPVTLKMHDTQGMTQEDFELLIAGPVKAKYPNITVELVKSNLTQVTNAVTAKEQIDIITIFNGNWGTIKDLQLFEDLNPLVKQQKYDLSRFDPGALKTISDLSAKGELFALPYHMQFNALYYNKDLFDKFAVPYPKDGLIWEEAIDIARALTRSDGGTQYSGLGMDGWSRLTYPLSVVPVDAKTNKSAVGTEPFRKAFTIAQQLYSIPGNAPVFSNNPFIKDKTQAMAATVNLLGTLAASDLKWDVAQYPSYKEKPNVFTQYDLHIAAISKTSAHKEEAMKALDVFLSDEVQTVSTSRTGRVPVLNNPQIRAKLGADNPALKDKKLASIFKSKPADNAAQFTKWHSKSYEIANKYVVEFLSGKKDMNTAFREADEEINQYIAANP
ncbi:MAG: transporter substrate-binding protein [Paenibacillus sp.]|jgi:multiple sugar transport system substrate-binding protein|nr:transporter substrate-binding protein [Paenibacillus sp.]